MGTTRIYQLVDTEYKGTDYIAVDDEKLGTRRIQLSSIGGGYGGGVIDGTLLKSKETKTITTSLREIYTTENDCLLVGIVYRSNDSASAACKFKIGDNWIVVDDGGASSDSSRFSFHIPIKKGITISAINSTASCSVDLYEYKLNSLAPQIAMPDYDESKKKEVTYSSPSTYWEAPENGWIQAYIYPTNANDYGYVSINNVKICEARDNDDSWIYQQYSISPISKGDRVTYGNGSSYKIYFYPCKSVVQYEDESETPLIDWDYQEEGQKSGYAIGSSGTAVQWRYDNVLTCNQIYEPGRYVANIYPLKEPFTKFKELRIVFGDYSGGTPDITAKTIKTRDLDWLLKLPLNSSCKNLDSISIPNSPLSEYKPLLTPYNGSAAQKFSDASKSTTTRLISLTASYTARLLEIYGIGRK